MIKVIPWNCGDPDFTATADLTVSGLTPESLSFGTDWGVGVGEEGRDERLGQGRWGKARGWKIREMD